MQFRQFRHSLAAVFFVLIFAAGLSAPAGAEEDRRVLITNKTSVAMMEFYASSIASKTWEEDILGKDVLMPGDEVLIDIDDGSYACRYDFKAVFMDGDEVVDEDIDVCEVAEYEFTEE